MDTHSRSRGLGEVQAAAVVVREAADQNKGSTYLSYKKQPGAESYLNGEGNRSGRVWKTRMRACAAPLQAELFREHRESSPACKLCGAAVEDQTHMLVNCVAYERARGRMYAQVRKEVGDGVWMEYANTDVGLGCWLLSDEDCDLPVKQFLAEAWRIRADRMGQKDQHG